ncbi:MAG: YqgE/AlgH family protein [Chitinophagales bacterium]
MMNEEEKPIWSYNMERHKPLKAGQLLLSEPFMWDENFKRTVVLVCSHTTDGTSGLLLNKPVQLKLQDLISDFPEAFDAALYFGGPVGTDLVQILHTVGNELEGSRKICDGVWWGGDFKQLKDRIRQGKISPDQVRFYLGYSGWEGGQLDQEMHDNSWIISPATKRYVFYPSHDQLWKNVMEEMGGLYRTMAQYPENPILN